MRDYDEMAPPGNAWSEVLLIHNRKPESFLCPRRGALPQGYAMHSALAGAPQSAIDFPAKSISFFDVDARGNDVLDDGKLLPRPPRHFDGNNIAFVDGHVKWMQNPDFKFGYDAKFAKRNSEARAASAKFWAEYQAKQRAKQRKVAAQKKAVKP
jgi:prepilin-type processing-associated H-X9-DG protein